VNARVPSALAVPIPSRLCVGSSVTMISRWGMGCELKGKAAVVLAAVALEGHADRRRMSAMLWPTSDGVQARSNLRVLTHRINQKFGDELLVGSEHLALTCSQVQVELLDVEALLAALEGAGPARCELLAEAGLESDAGEELQAWLAAARQRLRHGQLKRLNEALAQALVVDSHGRALALARACVQLDPLSEHQHRRLMEALACGGDRAAALAAYEECKGVLRQHLGVLPGLQTRTVQLRILQEQALGPAQGTQQAPQADGLTTLGGAARYPLVEREAVLKQAQAALTQGAHVVVRGEPGVGKTRLLRHLATCAHGEVEPVAIRSALKQEPYAAIAQLLQEVQLRRMPNIGMPEQIELARLAPLAFVGVKPSEAALSAPRLHAALRHWQARLGDAGVRVLLVDDVQHADAASQAALASLLEEAGEAAGRAPLLLLGHRSGEIESVLDTAVTDAQTRHRALRVELPRLTLAGVQTLIGAMDLAQRTSAPEALAQQLHKRTGGNPLFVIELAQQALEHGEAGDTASLQALLVSSLKRCGAAAQQLAAVAAVAAEDFTVELAASLTRQTALALMPAWGELQQRGLFAGHGLAHDLVQDAVLAGLPQAILQLLHRQVGQYLEGQGMRGVAVLRYWLAAGDADHALPHAAHQLYALIAAGLATRQQELELLGLMERASDAVLSAHLWLTAELQNGMGGALPAQTWHRVRALRQRVERWPGHAARADWIAFETARERWLIDSSAKAAYDVLAPAAQRMPAQGIERAFVERTLSLLAAGLTGDARAHLQRAREALAELPQQPSVNRLRMEIEDGSSMFLDPAEGILTLAARWRAGRKRGDLAYAARTGMRMGFLQAVLGNASHALRHYKRAARLLGGDAQNTDQFENPFLVGKFALNAGHYELSRRLLLGADDCTAQEARPVHLALLFLRLGDMRQVKAQLGLVTRESLRHFPAQSICAHARAELDRFEGKDPAHASRQQLEQALAQGLSGINRDLMTWEIERRTQAPADRLDRARALLRELRRVGTSGARQVKALLEIAEVYAEVDDPQSASLTADVARLLRRGYTNPTLYLPEGLVRCAKLIRHRDPREADSLMHVARRWVHNALRHLPQGTQQGFVSKVAVNRLLLDEDELVLYP
jgi:DNA-binding SARP family transcriptional activator/energy-coupling factor transporter ATP-binding protein EcfA2